MTPLYSKETAEDYIAAANGRRELGKGKLAETNAIERLIENGNEVMRLMGRAETACRAYGAEYLAEDLGLLIKKIKGEG